ncbi:exported protein of unknown function [Cardinium endosymbiont cEper1 of Encarsia pergandiella]|nr:exported protein of unknown function [Cardinium endosymbiont cEper1 of Encarsia pergandiella]
MRRSLFLSTMGTFLFAFNCNKDAHTFRTKAIQNRLHPDFRVLNDPSADYFSYSSSIKNDQDRWTAYNGSIQQVVDSTPSKMPPAVVAVTDHVKEHVETSSVSIQTDDHHAATSSISIQIDKEHAEVSIIANQTNGLLEEADCDGHKDEFPDDAWDHSFDTDIDTYSFEDEYDGSIVDEILLDRLSNLFSESSDRVENNQIQHDDNHSMIQHDKEDHVYTFPEELKDALKRTSHTFLSLNILPEDK